MVPEESEEEECLSQIDAAFNHPTQKYAYVISRDRYVRLEANDRYASIFYIFFLFFQTEARKSCCPTKIEVDNKTKCL